MTDFFVINLSDLFTNICTAFYPVLVKITLVQVTEDNFSVNLDTEYQSNNFFNFLKVLILESQKMQIDT